jgi:hypothetical protein
VWTANPRNRGEKANDMKIRLLVCAMLLLCAGAQEFAEHRQVTPLTDFADESTKGASDQVFLIRLAALVDKEEDLLQWTRMIQCDPQNCLTADNACDRSLPMGWDCGDSPTWAMFHQTADVLVEEATESALATGAQKCDFATVEDHIRQHGAPAGGKALVIHVDCSLCNILLANRSVLDAHRHLLIGRMNENWCVPYDAQSARHLTSEDLCCAVRCAVFVPPRGLLSAPIVERTTISREAPFAECHHAHSRAEMTQRLRGLLDSPTLAMLLVNQVRLLPARALPTGESWHWGLGPRCGA